MSSMCTSSCLRWVVLASLCAWSVPGWTQQSTPPPGSSEDSLSESVRELRRQVQELQAAVAEIRSEAQEYRAETVQLRRELESLHGRSDLPATAAAARGVSSQQTPSTVSEGQAAVAQSPPAEKPSHAASVEEEYQLLAGKIDDQYQTKVESAAKYRMRLSGIVLLNLFGNGGTVDNIDFPAVAYENLRGSSGGSFGGTLRQSQVGFEVFGPHLAGARSKADLQLDLAGGFPQTLNGVNSGILRLRTGTVRLDWERTSLVGGQDSIFFAPGSPTSFASLAIPALSYAGNLWNWVPQLRVEHRVSLGEDSNLLLQGGILDPVSGDPIYRYYRQPQAGELSRQPAYGTRVAWTRTLFGQPLRMGLGGYYSRQDYGFNRRVDGWAGMADLEVPMSRRLSLTGKLYRGRALGGLGGGIGRSVLFNGDPTQASTAIRPLNAAGGWTQLKYRATSTVEFNAAVGMDNPYSADMHAFGARTASFGDPTLIKNQGGVFNVIYRPRSDLLFSAEYHRMHTFTVDNGSYSANHINLVMGVLF